MHGTMPALAAGAARTSIAPQLAQENTQVIESPVVTVRSTVIVAVADPVVLVAARHFTPPARAEPQVATRVPSPLVPQVSPTPSEAVPVRWVKVL